MNSNPIEWGCFAGSVWQTLKGRPLSSLSGELMFGDVSPLALLAALPSDLVERDRLREQVVGTDQPAAAYDLMGIKKRVFVARGCPPTAAEDGAGRITKRDEARLPSWISDHFDVEQSGASDEEHIVHLWETVLMWFVELAARSKGSSPPGASNEVGIVLFLSSLWEWAVLQQRIASLLCRWRQRNSTFALSHVIVVLPKPPADKGLESLRPMLNWENATNVELAKCSASPLEKFSIANVRAGLQVKTASLTRATATDAAVPLERPHDVSPPLAEASAETNDQPTLAPLPTPDPLPAPSDALPIMECMERILHTIQTSPSRMTLLDGPTGCGKSTRVPVAIANQSSDNVVWVAQPRRVAAIALCNRVNFERGSSFDAAYAIGGSSTDSLQTTRILYMTSGVMLQRVKSAFRTGKYLTDFPVTHILLDEVHERTVEYDILLCALREMLKHHPSLKLVLMSATMSCRGLQEYLNLSSAALWPPTPPTCSTFVAHAEGIVSRKSATAASRDFLLRGPQETATSFDAIYGNHWRSAGGGVPGEDLAPLSLQKRLEEAQHRVPVIHVPSQSRPRRFFYLQDAMHMLFRPPADHQETLSLTQVPNGQDVAYLKLPFSVREILVKPNHATGLLWEARMAMLILMIRRLHETRPLHEAMLIFVSGLGHIEQIQAELQHSSQHETMTVLGLHSSNDAENAAVFNDVGAAKRKVLIATNIAESSLTIPDVDIVIDTCLVKDQRYLCEERLSMLEERYCSKDSCEQRAGRTGRVRPGTVWRLVTKEEFESFDEARTPGVLQTSLATTMLAIADANVGDLDEFVAALPTPPSKGSVYHALSDLKDHYKALQLAVVANRPLLQPSIKGTIMASLGIDAQYAHFVLNCVLLGVPVAGVQAAAILSASAALVVEEHNMDLLLFDNGTSSDMVAFVNLFRWWLRRRNRFLVANDGAQETVERTIASGIRENIAADIRSKSTDMMRSLAQFGLAPVSFLEVTSNAQWESQQDTDQLNADDLIRFIAAVTMSFVQRSIVATAKHRQGPVKNRIYTPINKVILTLRGPTSPADMERVEEFIKPAKCTATAGGGGKKDNGGKIVVTVDVPRRIDPHTGVQTEAFAVREVRNMSFDAYRLMKCGRTARKRLNISYGDVEDHYTQLLSSWFVECRAPLYLNQSSLLYPLTFDYRCEDEPAVIACQAIRRFDRVNILNALLLPGKLSLFPYCAATVLHWDGKSTDERSCLALPTLPHCHPSPSYFQKGGVEMDDLMLLQDRFHKFFDRCVGFVQSSPYMDAVECCRLGGGSDAAEHLVTMIELHRHRVQFAIDEMASVMCRVLVTYLRDLPPYFAPTLVRTFIATHATNACVRMHMMPHVQEALVSVRKVQGTIDSLRPTHAESEAWAKWRDDVGCAGLASQRGWGASLISRATVSGTQLRKYRETMASRSTLSRDHFLTIMLVHHSPDAIKAQIFLKEFGRCLPLDHTMHVLTQQVRCSSEWMALGRCDASKPTQSEPSVAVLLDLTSEMSNGALLYTVAALLLRETSVSNVWYCVQTAFQQRTVSQMIHATIRHSNPVVQELTRWRVLKKLDARQLASSQPAKHDATNVVVALVFFPPEDLLMRQARRALASPCDLSEVEEDIVHRMQAFWVDVQESRVGGSTSQLRVLWVILVRSQRVQALLTSSTIQLLVGAGGAQCTVVPLGNDELLNSNLSCILLLKGA